MIKVYLAGRYERGKEFQQYAQMLCDIKDWDGESKFEVNARWLRGLHCNSAKILGAEQDLQDVEEADWFVFFSESEGATRGGRHVEFGYFLSRMGQINMLGLADKKMFVIAPEGYKENVFHHLLPDGCFYKSFEEWIEKYVRFV